MQRILESITEKLLCSRKRKRNTSQKELFNNLIDQSKLTKSTEKNKYEDKYKKTELDHSNQKIAKKLNYESSSDEDQLIQKNLSNNNSINECESISKIFQTGQKKGEFLKNGKKSDAPEKIEQDQCELDSFYLYFPLDESIEEDKKRFQIRSTDEKKCNIFNKNNENKLNITNKKRNESDDQNLHLSNKNENQKNISRLNSYIFQTPQQNFRTISSICFTNSNMNKIENKENFERQDSSYMRQSIRNEKINEENFQFCYGKKLSFSNKDSQNSREIKKERPIIIPLSNKKLYEKRIIELNRSLNKTNFKEGIFDNNDSNSTFGINQSELDSTNIHEKIFENLKRYCDFKRDEINYPKIQLKDIKKLTELIPNENSEIFDLIGKFFFDKFSNINKYNRKKRFKEDIDSYRNIVKNYQEFINYKFEKILLRYKDMHNNIFFMSDSIIDTFSSFDYKLKFPSEYLFRSNLQNYNRILIPLFYTKNDISLEEENLNNLLLLININMLKKKIILYGYEKYHENYNSDINFNSVLKKDKKLMKILEDIKKFFDYYITIVQKSNKEIDDESFFLKNSKDKLNKDIPKHINLGGKHIKYLKPFDSEESSSEDEDIHFREWRAKCAYYRKSSRCKDNTCENENNIYSKNSLVISRNDQEYLIKDYDDNEKEVTDLIKHNTTYQVFCDTLKLNANLKNTRLNKSSSIKNESFSLKSNVNKKNSDLNRFMSNITNPLESDENQSFCIKLECSSSDFNYSEIPPEMSNEDKNFKKFKRGINSKHSYKNTHKSTNYISIFNSKGVNEKNGSIINTNQENINNMKKLSDGNISTKISEIIEMDFNSIVVELEVEKNDIIEENIVPKKSSQLEENHRKKKMKNPQLNEKNEYVDDVHRTKQYNSLIDQLIYICRVIYFIFKKQSVVFCDEDRDYLLFQISLDIIKSKGFIKE